MNEDHVGEWFEQTLKGSITDEDADGFLDWLKEDPANCKLFRDNVMMNLLLERQFQMRPASSDLLARQIMPEYEPSVLSEQSEHLVPLFAELDSRCSMTEECDEHDEAKKTPNSSPDIRHPLIRAREAMTAKVKPQKELDLLKIESIPENHHVRRANKFSEYMFGIRLVVFFAIISWLAWNGANKNDRRPQRVGELAQVTALIDAKWPTDCKPLRLGQYIDPTKISLVSGTVKLDFKNGATTLLEGPVELTISDPLHMFCSQGRISATISETARGFEVATPFATFVDRGTEFAVTIDQKTAILDVVKGSVDASVGNTPEPYQTVAGKSFEVLPNRTVLHGNANPKRFLDEKTFSLRMTDYAVRKKNEMNMLNRQFDASPGLLARFDFSGSTSGTIENLSTEGRTVFRQASIQGGTSVPGRLPGSSALGIQKRRDSITTDLKYQFTNMTLSTWVRIDNLNNTGNVLIAGNNFFSARNEFLWQVVQDGRLQFQINEASLSDGDSTKSTRRSSPGDGIGFSYFESEPMVRPGELRGWFHLALVVDTTQKSITHYLDGKAVSTHEWKNVSPLKCDGLTIANISGRTTNARFFDGALSDLFIFDRALTPEEIVQLAQH